MTYNTPQHYYFSNEKKLTSTLLIPLPLSTSFSVQIGNNDLCTGLLLTLVCYFVSHDKSFFVGHPNGTVS